MIGQLITYWSIFVNNFSTFLLCKITNLEIFHMVYIFEIFFILRGIEILIESQFSWKMYVPYILVMDLMEDHRTIVKRDFSSMFVTPSSLVYETQGLYGGTNKIRNSDLNYQHIFKFILSYIQNYVPIGSQVDVYRRMQNLMVKLHPSKNSSTAQVHPILYLKQEEKAQICLPRRGIQITLNCTAYVNMRRNITSLS